MLQQNGMVMILEIIAVFAIFAVLFWLFTFTVSQEMLSSTGEDTDVTL